MKISLLQFIPLIVFLFFSGCSIPKVNYPDELKQLHENALAYILEEPVNTDTVKKLLSNLNDNGSWSDVNYDYKVDGPWITRDHLVHLLDVVRAYQTRGNKYYHKKLVKEKIHLALNYWLDNNFLSPYAWWYNEIGTPQLLASIMLLMENELSEMQFDQGIKILNRAKIKYTGQNRVWVSGIVLIKAMMLRDIDSVSIAGKSIRDILVVTRGEGIQKDWSFHQHGSQLQFGNYGLSYVGDMIRWINILRNTPFAFEESKMEILRNYMLEGLQWASWKGKFDVTACGRKLQLNSASEKTTELAGYFQKMIKLDPEYAGEYEKAMDYKNLEGHKHFWRSEYQVKRTSEYFFSVKMVSERVKGGESSRYENVNGYYMGDGATYIYHKGNEFENIFPYWNWRKVPGTTIQQDDKKLPLLLAVGYFIESDFTGGVSNGENGIAVMDYKRDGLSAKKSWFIFNDMIICLGAGISSTENLPVTTSVNQSFFRDSAFIKTSSGVHLSAEEQDISDPDWILHDQTGYFFPAKAKLRLETKMVEGSWYRYATYLKDEKTSAGIFNLWFEHGKNPKNASYTYVLVPNATQAKLEKIRNEPGFIIQNTADIQEAATNDGSLAGVIFYKPGKSKVFGGIEVNKPCMVMLTKEDGGIRVCMADPTQKLSEIRLKINGNYQAEGIKILNGQSIVNVSLPRGEEAGKTTMIYLKKL